MLCMTNFARAAARPAALASSRPLDQAADHKSADILACDELQPRSLRAGLHVLDRTLRLPSGLLARPPRTSPGGPASSGSVRAIFSAWMNSAGHRANILGQYEEIGIGLRVGRLEGNSGAARLDPGLRHGRC